LSSDTTQDLGQISIRGMLIATAVVAAVMGLCRMGLWIVNSALVDERFGEPFSAASWWGDIGIATAIAIGVSTVVLPVTSLLVLRLQSRVLGILLAVCYLAVCASIFVVVMSVSTGDFPDLEGYAMLLAFFVTITGYLLTSLVIFRSAGYRLWWGREGSAKMRRE
jgi:hypothetical protein